MGSRGLISLARRRDLRGCRGFKMDPIDGSCISFDVLQADDASSFKSQDSISLSSSTINLQPSKLQRLLKISSLNVQSRVPGSNRRLRESPLQVYLYGPQDIQGSSTQVPKTLNALNPQVSWTHSPIIDPFATHQHRCDHSTRIHLWTISSLSISFFSVRWFASSPLLLSVSLSPSRVASCLWTLVSLSAPNPLSLASPLLCPLNPVHHRFV